MSKLRDLVDHANKIWAPQERPFTSSLPLVGPVIVTMRRAWNSMSTKWYVRPILDQQIAFNLTLVQIINELCTILEQQERPLSNQIRDAEGMIISTDRDQASLAKEVARLRHQLNQLRGSATLDLSTVSEAAQKLKAALDARAATEGEDANSVL